MRSRGGDPGGACTVTNNGAKAKRGAGIPGTSRITSSRAGVEWSDDLDARSSSPPWTVALQQSSELEGRHLPFLQQSTAFWSRLGLEKQSRGRTSSTMAAMDRTTLMLWRILF
ncbi:MAG: hypothetical protein JWN34_4473 [Bryobacterales bacterium]|nr:hypothetical protein [Bryobacterales bacterium]